MSFNLENVKYRTFIEQFIRQPSDSTDMVSSVHHLNTAVPKTKKVGFITKRLK